MVTYSLSRGKELLHKGNIIEDTNVKVETVHPTYEGHDQE